MNTKTRVAAMLIGCLLGCLVLSFPVMSQEKASGKAEPAKAKPAAEKKQDAGTGVSEGDIHQKVAVVNGVAIERKELNRILQGMQSRQRGMGGQPNGVDPKQMEAEALENAVVVELLKQEAKKKKMEATDAEVDERIGQIRRNFPGDKEFDEMLAKVNMTQASLKDQMKQDIQIRKLIDTEVADKIQIQDSEIKAYYDEHLDAFKKPEQVKASHILVKVDAGADEAKKAEARKKIQEIQQKVKAGGDFEALAKENSDCPSKEKGGDLGFFPKNAMVKPFSDAAFAMQPGQISDIVETQFGYHLIKVTDRTPEGTQSFDEVKPNIARFLKQNAVQKEMQTYIEGLKKTAKIEKRI